MLNSRRVVSVDRGVHGGARVITTVEEPADGLWLAEPYRDVRAWLLRLNHTE
jgi:hypothetical protein